MWNRLQLKRILIGFALLATTLQPGRATAEPLTVSGSLFGDLRFARVVSTLDLQFRGFSLVVPVDNQLRPGFCLDGCGTPIRIPFTQTTGAFSGHSQVDVGGPSVADVTGTLAFVGPTKLLTVDPFGGGFVSAPTELSGILRVTQGNRVLFNGSLTGSGLASVVYENVGVAGTRFAGYQYTFSGVAATPEPPSLILLGCGAAWLGFMRRKWRLRLD